MSLSANANPTLIIYYLKDSKGMFYIYIYILITIQIDMDEYLCEIAYMFFIIIVRSKD